MRNDDLRRILPLVAHCVLSNRAPPHERGYEKIAVELTPRARESPNRAPRPPAHPASKAVQVHLTEKKNERTISVNWLHRQKACSWPFVTSSLRPTGCVHLLHHIYVLRGVHRRPLDVQVRLVGYRRETDQVADQPNHHPVTQWTSWHKSCYNAAANVWRCSNATIKYTCPTA